MSDVHLILWLSVLAGALALDETALLQVMVSQPVVAGAVAGVVVGDLGLGLLVGSALQLVWIGALPVGAAPFPDGAAAGVAGAGTAALMAGAGASAGIAVGTGILVGLLAGAAGTRLIVLVRRLNVSLSIMAEKRGETGSASGVSTAVFAGLAIRFAASFVLAAVALGVALALSGPAAAFDVSGEFPAVLWAAPVAAAAVAVGGRGKIERAFLASGFVVGLVIVILV
jgi:mannose/fructose/N-acetylgalactosamine-specific phosphotransferase system component IIC